MVVTKFILSKKIGMGQVFNEEGNYVPVTLLEAGPCTVIQIKSEDNEGYDAVQFGFGEIKKLKKPQEGHLKKVSAFAKATADKQSFSKWLREFKIGKPELKLGDVITVDIFKAGDKVDISGISKGKGFSGVIKRHGFSRGPASHGSDHHREPGSIGSMFPQRVVKGRKLPGRMGRKTVTIRNLKVIKVDSSRNLLCVAGAVPGAKNELLLIRSKDG
jgi:large subunit ribosomal protein L3